MAKQQNPKKPTKRRFELILDVEPGEQLENIAKARGFVQGPAGRANMSSFLKATAEKIIREATTAERKGTIRSAGKSPVGSRT